MAARPDLAFILAGYEPDNETPRIFSLTSQSDFGPMLHNYGFAVQGVPQYALYLLNRLYQPDRTVDELTALAVYSITETASQDGKVGGPINVITITPDGGCEALDHGYVDGVIELNEERSQALRESFYEQGS